jgi:hypothetical protein
MLSRKYCLNIFGLQESTTDQDIRKQYLKLCLLYHPDKNPNNAEAEAKFKQVTNAYNYLFNKEYPSEGSYVFQTVMIETMVKDDTSICINMMPYYIRFYKEVSIFAKYLFRNDHHVLYNEVRSCIDNMLSINLHYYPLTIFDDDGFLRFTYTVLDGYRLHFPEIVMATTLSKSQLQTGLEVDLFLSSAEYLETLVEGKRDIFDTQYYDFDLLDHTQYEQKHKLVYHQMSLQDKFAILGKYCIKVTHNPDHDHDHDHTTEQYDINKINNILMKYKL